jgi:hypothetical protein
LQGEASQSHPKNHLSFCRQNEQLGQSVVDQAIGNCKTEASRKPVVMDEHIAQAFIAWRQESMYTGPNDWVWASPQKKGKQPLWLSTIMRYYIEPAARRAGINTSGAALEKESMEVQLA